jgi:peptidyl-prolyl cis-trans isomerase B (cyclophilin B)
VRPLLIMAGLAGAVAVSIWLHGPRPPAQTEPNAERASADPSAPVGGEPGVDDPQAGVPQQPAHARATDHGAEAKQDDKKPTNAKGSFLEAFGGQKSEGGSGAGAAANDELEKQFLALTETRESLEALKERAAAVPDLVKSKALDDVLAERDRLVDRMNKQSVAFEKAVAAARQARPQDPVPQWLTGELLILVGGEPEQMLPYLERAVAAGLDRSRLYASLSWAEIEANQFAKSYDSAVKALDKSPQDHYAWNAFTRIGFSMDRFAAVTERLKKAFPKNLPGWTAEILRDGTELEAKWQAEQKLRQAEKKADNLPRVRLTIEHRRFAKGSTGAPDAKIESTGRGEVILELYEDQAPATVANFLSLVSQGFYDGTRFHMAEPARVVAGGDPNSKRSDTADDGTGGPGYVIPDEFALPDTRGHFRGVLSMINTGPHTTGSMFFITLVAKPEMNGHFTAFGRVIQGQDVVDRITPGRTTPLVGHFGKVVPGDLLVRAEIIRKRPHEYRVIKRGERGR